MVIPEESSYRRRKYKIYLYAALAAICLFRGFPLLFAKNALWSLLFWVGGAWAFISLTRLERRDLAAEKAEDEAAAGDPRHLYQPALGFSAHPELRSQVAYGMLMSGGGVLFGAFQLLHVGMIFWGAGLLIAGVILLFGFG